jgi:uncharacterized membrane protein
MIGRIGHAIAETIGRVWTSMLKAASVALWAQIGAGMAFTIGAGCLVWIIWKGPWTPAVEAARLSGLVGITFATLGLVAVALVAIAGLRLGVKASKDGFDASVERDDEPHTFEVKEIKP